MTNWIKKHKIAFTLSVMLAIALIGGICMVTIGSYNGLAILLIIWSIPTVLGVVSCVIACIALLFSKTNRKPWHNMLLIGLWFLLVSGGSCGMLHTLLFGVSHFIPL